MENLINLFYLFRWWFLVTINRYSNNSGANKNNNFTLSKEWDFTNTDFDSLANDFRYSPPWGNKVNQRCSFKLDKRGIALTPEGVTFTNIINPDGDSNETPFISGALVSKSNNYLPSFGKVSARYAIQRTEGNWCAFWTTDSKNTMPESDIVEFFGFKNGKRKLSPNTHYGTAYNSKKYKYQYHKSIYFPEKLNGRMLEWSAEFYPNKTIYKINNIPVYYTTRSCSTNEKVVWLNGGTWYDATSDNVGESSRVEWLKYYSLVDVSKP
tara:strand:+ start:306 stop:1106 length:801 start_codon:yes stop_codon:yes gene_type:complete